jgi:hypothetical protein
MSDLDGLFADLQQISSALNQELAAVNERIAALEQSISELKLGVTVWLLIDKTSDDYGHVYETLLGWTKDKHGWGLFLMDQIDNESHGELRRLNDGSREERLAALEAVPAFLKRMKEEAARVLKEVQRASQSTPRVIVRATVPKPKA